MILKINDNTPTKSIVIMEESRILCQKYKDICLKQFQFVYTSLPNITDNITQKNTRRLLIIGNLKLSLCEQLSSLPPLKANKSNFLNRITSQRFVKIVILPELSFYNIQKIYKELSPKSILCRSNTTESELIQTLELVNNGYESIGINIGQYLKTAFIDGAKLDFIDLELLYLTSIGLRINDLAKHTFISRANVERRKRILRELLNDPSNDFEMIDRAKQLNLI